MSETHIDTLLDELVPPFHARDEGWTDVVRRARLRRRRRMLVGAAAIAALAIVPTGLAVGGRVIDLFQGTPANPAVAADFAESNKMADTAIEEGFGSHFPHVDVSRVHGVLEVETPDGPEDLWAAPNDQGGRCWFVDFADDPPLARGGAQLGGGGCDTPSIASTVPASHITWDTQWRVEHPALLTLTGRVYLPATRVEVRLGDETTLSVPAVEGFFLASLDRDAKVVSATAYDAGGNQVATMTVPS